MRLHDCAALALMLCCNATSCLAQGNAKGPDQHVVLEQILTQIYQPSEVGKHMMGIGADADVRRPGVIVVVQREGLYGSLMRNETASSAIHGVEAQLYRGHQDYSVPIGERFYVTAVHVGSSTIDIGLLSTRTVSTSHGVGRVWTITTFYLPEDVLATAEKDAAIREIDQWIVPEGHGREPSALSPAAERPTSEPVPAPVATPPASTPVSLGQAARSANTTEALSTGMTREQVLVVLGKPQREVTFESQTWMHYPGMVVLLRNGKLTSVEQALPTSTASVTLRSEPKGAEIYIDGQLTGSTPSKLEVPSGNHKISIRLAGYADWVRDVNVLAGSETQFEATLAKQ